DIVFEQVEEGPATRGGVFGAQAVQGILDLQQGPALVKDRVGRSRVFGGFQGVTFFGIELIEGEDGLASAALECGGALMFVREEVLEGRQEKRAESTRLRVRPGHKTTFQQIGEESLRQVLRVRGRMPESAEERIERIPIGAAKLFQSGPSAGLTAISGGQHYAPVRGGELAVGGRRGIGL